MKNIISPLLIYIVGLVGCNYDSASGGTLSVFDVESAIGNKQLFDMSDIVHGLEFIPLDNSNTESMLGNIQKMRESEDRFYISDGTTKPIKVFDRNGYFLSSRGHIGRGPTEMPFINDFTVDSRRDRLYAQGVSSVVSYDSSGNVLVRNDSIRSSQIADYNDELIILKRDSDSGPDNTKTLLEVFSPDLQYTGNVEVADKGSSEILKLTSGAVMTVVYSGSGIMFNNGSSLFVKETLSDTVFCYQGDRTLKPSYIIDMGRYSVPAESFGENPKEPWDGDHNAIADVYDGERYVIVKIAGYSGESFSFGYVVLDKNDPSSGFMATASAGMQRLLLDGIKFTPCYIRDNRLVGYMQAIDIVDGAAAITNPDLATLAATLKADSNPVIVVATLQK